MPKQETGIVPEKNLGFFKKIRKNLLIRNITKEKYLKAPDYLKNNREVIDAVISRDSSALNEMDKEQLLNIFNIKREYVNLVSYERQEEILKTNPDMIAFMSDNTKKRIIYSNEALLECIKYISIQEQVDILTKEQDYEGKRSFDVRGLTTTHTGNPRQFGKTLEYFSKEAIMEAFKILRQDPRYDEYNKERIPLLSTLDISKCDKEFQKSIAGLDIAFLLSKMSDEAAIEFINYNPLLIDKLSPTCIRKVIEKDPKYINCVSRKEMGEILEETPEYIDQVSLQARLRMRLVKKIPYEKASAESIKREMVDFDGIQNYYSEIIELVDNKEVLMEIAKCSPKALSPRFGSSDMDINQGNIINMYQGKIDNELFSALKEWKDKYAKDPQEFENIIKIISNDKVLSDVPKEKIIDYINSQDMEKMKEIITSAYGEKAGQIIKSRPGLTMQDIPNLYIFDKKIIDEFGVGTVHNMLSFDTKGAIALSELARNSEKMELFKRFSKMAGEVYEDSALGFEQKLKSFSRHFDLIKDMSSSEITEERIKQLQLLLTNDISNLGKIKGNESIVPENTEQLDSYSEKLSQTYDECLDKVETKEDVKDLISRKFFGVKYSIDREQYSPQEYPLEAILNYYNIGFFVKDERTLQSGNFSQEELDKLELAKIISEVDDVDTLKEIYSNLSKEKEIAEVLDFKKTVKKVPMQYSKEVIDSLLTVDKAREMFQKGEKGISIETKDGIEIIKLNGADFKMLIHSMGLNNSGINDIYGKDAAELWKNLESGVSTISGSLIESEMLASCDNPYGVNLGFSDISPNQIIGMGHTDIHVSHVKKDIDPAFSYGKVKYNYSDELVRKTAAQISGTEEKDITHEYNEITMNRFKVSPKDIDETEGSGKIMPNYIVVYGTAEGKHYDAAKKFGNIPVVEIDTDVYTTELAVRARKSQEFSKDRGETRFIRSEKNVIGDDYER